MKKKLLLIQDDTYTRIRKFRHRHEITTEAEAFRLIIEAGLAYLEGESYVGVLEETTRGTQGKSHKAGQSEEADPALGEVGQSTT